jgi:hypothetical protein
VRQGKEGDFVFATIGRNTQSEQDGQRVVQKKIKKNQNHPSKEGHSPFQRHRTTGAPQENVWMVNCILRG